MKTIITKIENNRVVKFLEIEDELAEDKLAELLPNFPDALIYDGAYFPSLWVENGEVTTAEIIKPIEEQIAEKQAELDAIEREELMPRSVRESLIAIAEKEAAVLLAPLEGQALKDYIYEHNPAYQGWIDVDTIATALRAEIRALDD